MWPWEHAALGYLCYSLAVRRAWGRPPTDTAAAVVVVGTLLPDLVDKPLSWGLGVFPTGHGAAHSVFVALAVALVAVAVAERIDRRPLGLALSVGYVSHLLGDVIDPLRTGGRVAVGRILWPLVRSEPYEQEHGLARGLIYLREFLAELSTVDPTSLAALYLVFPLAAVFLWLADGAPGVGLLWHLTRTYRRS